ncbi:hypothetical protein M011DRAFT_492413 [Sporormia fimetaria CBS 119925]|uniref:Uncharacterized protein n=1 Tax=Sporormia fimetaria CBS 119925 TaxID=1340428 RepID=A0A6A6VJY1_9PLEO|nr:hypothetical protein M011DRAFT_492413 [Sporormia fimetaria CBS 119925]
MPPLVSSPPTDGGAGDAEAVIRVVCAWPVSGQYGPGSRILYYVLVAACIQGRRYLWLRNTCLAIALVFPAVAALHALVLTAVHVNGAVDMDVYGALQFCTIGILAAPTTVRLSKTYQNAPGRNTIFLWTALVVAGLLSLVVEFYRANPIPCSYDDSGNPLPHAIKDFPFKNAHCSLQCSDETGPFSPMRGGAASNIYVIPAPDMLKFNTALVLAAACCIPAILSVAFTWIQILENNWTRRIGHVEADPDDKLITGTNGATIGTMKQVAEQARKRQNYIEVPLFVCAVLALVVFGELNFFSTQVRYETEPMASIGQWAPIAGTALAGFSSVYVVVAGEIEAREKHRAAQALSTQIVVDGSDEARSGPSDDIRRISTSRRAETGMTRLGDALHATVAQLSDAAHAKLDDSEFKRGPARNFPETPGEIHRNANLSVIRERYNPPRDPHGDVTPEFGPVRSRSPSFISVHLGLGISGINGSPGSPPLSTPARRDTLEVPSFPSPAFHRT